MAELLIYNKSHWMDALTPEQVAERVQASPEFQRKYDARYQRGDVVEVREDGYWTEKHGWNKKVFSLFCVRDLSVNDAEKYIESLEEIKTLLKFNDETMEHRVVEIPEIKKRRKYNFSTSLKVGKMSTVNRIQDIDIEEKVLNG